MYENHIFKSKEYDLPIISVGNITVGGTGKTPHTEYVVRMLKDDFKTAVLSRGYKRKTKGFRLVEETDDYRFCGDEPLQVKQKFSDIIVAVCESRTKGIEELRRLFPDLGVIILDDAYQHRKVTPGLHILLNNYNFPISNDNILPLGRLREPKHNTNRAHIIIYTNCPPSLTPIERRILTKDANIYPYQYIFFSKVVYNAPKNLLVKENLLPVENLKNYNILAVTGIAHPVNFVRTLEESSNSVSHLRFGDHHNFSNSDIAKIQKEYSKLPNPKAIFVTEKDAVRLRNNAKLPEEIKQQIFYIDIAVELMANQDEQKQFNNQIISYVRNNKRYNKLYKNSF